MHRHAHTYIETYFHGMARRSATIVLNFPTGCKTLTVS